MTIEKFFEIAANLMLYGEIHNGALVDNNGNIYRSLSTGTRRLYYEGKEYILYKGENEVRGPYVPCYEK